METGQRSAQNSRIPITILGMVILFISHGILVWGHRDDPFLSDKSVDTMREDDEDFIDFTDMVNYDPVTKTMVNKKEKDEVKVGLTSLSQGLETWGWVNSNFDLSIELQYAQKVTQHA